MQYKCPVCTEAIDLIEELVICPRCLKKWNKQAHYPDFIENDFYWGEIPQEMMRDVCARARAIGWRNALAQIIKPSYPDIYRYVTDENRADWRIMINNIDKNSIMLDLGAGWGGISAIMSEHVGEVYSLEGVKERVEFLDIRRKQDNIPNMHPIRANFYNPPFYDETFDLIVCNGILEWVGLSDTALSPRDAQLQFLRRLRGLLKVNGSLYIGIENRFAYASFLGATDHSGLKYTNLLPRFLADFIVRVNNLFAGKTKGFFLDRGKGYRTYTYSLAGYRRLLSEAGFKNMEVYFAIPSYNSPKTLIPVDSPNLYQFYLNEVRPNTARATNYLKLLYRAYLTMINSGLSVQKLFENAFSLVVTK